MGSFSVRCMNEGTGFLRSTRPALGCWRNTRALPQLPAMLCPGLLQRLGEPGQLTRWHPWRVSHSLARGQGQDSLWPQAPPYPLWRIPFHRCICSDTGTDKPPPWGPIPGLAHRALSFAGLDSKAWESSGFSSCWAPEAA